MIEFRNVTKTYNNGTEALHNVNLKVEKGEFVFIVGSSGAGKSTFLKLITCEERLTQGQIIVDGVNISRLRKGKIPYIRRKMGMVFQDFRLIDQMTVYDNVAFAMRVVGARPKVIKKRVPYILSLVGLQHKAKHYPSELSGGERQRVGLARALVNNPSMIIADEPTGNIDPALSFEIVDLLSEINRRGTTVLMVTHEHSLVKHFHKRIIQIHSGEVVADTAAMAGTYAPPEQYQDPEEAVRDDDDYAEYASDAEQYGPEKPEPVEPVAFDDYEPGAPTEFADYEPENPITLEDIDLESLLPETPAESEGDFPEDPVFFDDIDLETLLPEDPSDFEDFKSEEPDPADPAEFEDFDMDEYGLTEDESIEAEVVELPAEPELSGSAADNGSDEVPAETGTAEEEV